MADISKNINILFIEDLPSDYELAVRTLTRGGLNISHRRVDTEKEMIEALSELNPEIVISDYSMPKFDGMRALKILLEHNSDIPFIMLTGSKNEETAAECIKAGAADYVIKERMKRLPFAVKEAMYQAEARKALRHTQTRYKQLLEGMLDGFVYVDQNGVIVDSNEAYRRMLGYSARELAALTYNDITPPGWHNYEEWILNEQIKKYGYSVVYEKEYRRKDGSVFPVELRTFLATDESGRYAGLWAIVRDISELRKTDKLIKTLNQTVEQSPVSIAITESDGSIGYVNKAFTSFRQYAPQEVIGRKPRIFNPGHLSDEDYELMWSTLRSGHPWEGEFKNRKRDGTEFWENVIISPLLQEDGTITNYILIMEDVTEKRQILDDLVAAKEKAEESDRLKTAFLHNISHEIRTPMNAIIGFSQFLNDPELLPEDRQTFSELIAQSSNQLLSIITDIVSIASIEAGQEKTVERETDINRVIRLVTEQYSIKAEGSDIILRYNLEQPDGECNTYTDEVKLTQILSNLVNNAIKFTHKGFVELGYLRTGGLIEFYVKDSGIGIEPAMHEKIFERFRQVETTETRQFGGSGLGLSISRAYVELLGGKIWLDSTPGKGTTFYFTIPEKKA
jgi:PAS domain S-box-containing protein